MTGTEELIRHALQEKLAITLVINKMDRLILELRLPPTEAYYKIKHTIEEVNTAISAINPDPVLRVSPENGNVAFASTQMGWCFTLRSFAQLYSDTFGLCFLSPSPLPSPFSLWFLLLLTAVSVLFKPLHANSFSSRTLVDIPLYPGPIDVEEFAPRLWGNVYFDEDTRKFTRTPDSMDTPRSFVHFVLEPLYKLYTQVCLLPRPLLYTTSSLSCFSLWMIVIV